MSAAQGVSTHAEWLRYERNIALTMNWHTWVTGDTKWTYHEQCHQMQAPWSDNAIMVFQHHLAHEVSDRCMIAANSRQTAKDCSDGIL